MRHCRLLASAALVAATMTHARAQPTSPADALVEREVRIETADPDVVLAGTLTLPSGKGPHAAALLIPGSGAHTRDQVISGTPMFRLIGDHLVRSGIATLRMDKRGVGKSTGPKDIEDCTPADFALDARACLQFLQEDEDIDPDRIGLIGHSEGAMVAPMVAAKEASLRFVVLLAPPAVCGGEIWVMQRLSLAKQDGLDASRAPALEQALKRLVAYGAAGQNDDATYYDIGRQILAAHGMPEAEITRELVDARLSDFRRPWYRFFFAHEPAGALRTLATPTLALMGSADRQVPVAQNLAPLVAALVEARNPDFTVSVVPDQDHFFLTFEGRRVEQHRYGKMQMNGRMLQVMTDWIAQHVK